MIPPHDLVGALALVAGPRAASDLSPPARVLFSALDAGVGQALGLGANLSQATLEALGKLTDEMLGSLGETIAEIVGDIAEVIPFVGPIIKGFISILSFALSGGESAEHACSRLFTTFKPTETGSLLAGGPSVPADIFARAHGIERWYTDDPNDFADVRKSLSVVWGSLVTYGVQRRFLPAGPLDCRSALAMALMQMTEGSIADVRDFDWGLVTATCHDLADDSEKKLLATPAMVRHRWGLAIERDARLVSRQWAKLHPSDAHRGLARGWRDRFRGLRRGIEASWAGNLQPGTVSDGGAALWIAYIDLLARAFDPASGYLTWDFAEYLFARQRHLADKLYAFKGPDRHSWHQLVEPLIHARPDRDYLDDTDLVATPPTWIWGEDPCPRMVVTNLRTLVEGWQHSIHPYYQQGQTKLAELERDAGAYGREVGTRRAPRIANAEATSLSEPQKAIGTAGRDA